MSFKLMTPENALIKENIERIFAKVLLSRQIDRNHEYNAWVEDAVSRLTPTHQRVIRERYLIDECMTDRHVHADVLMVSANTYRKWRTDAFEKLAIMLDVVPVMVRKASPFEMMPPQVEIR